jgi:hypothetical protein
MMKRTLILIFICLFCFATSAIAQVQVAVTPFEVTNYQHRQYADYARGELENLILNLGNIQIVERQRMDAMVEELSFGNFSGLADPNNVAKFGRMCGARVLVTGSILKADTEKKSFQGFGIATNSSQTVATIRIRAYDIQKSTVLYSTTTKGSSSSFKTSFGGLGKDEVSAAIEDALNNLSQDQRFQKVFSSLDGTTETQSAKVKLEIIPIPENCDLEINGVYQGSTPTIIELPAGNTVIIKLAKAGYLPWERKVAPRPGMRVAPELEQKSN